MEFKDVEFNIEEIDQSLRDAGIELKDKSNSSKLEQE